MYTDRFKDAPWYAHSRHLNIKVVGVGGIGSNALYNLTKTIPAIYTIADFDVVEESNVGTQFFHYNTIGKLKVEAIKESLEVHHSRYEDVYNIRPLTLRDCTASPITIVCVDNMAKRKDMFLKWNALSNKEILIEGRLKANLYELYVVIPGREKEYEKTLFDDSEASSEPCTFKQTAYFGMLIGARITHVLVNYLINKFAKEQICNIPFKVYEVGEPFIIEVT